MQDSSILNVFWRLLEGTKTKDKTPYLLSQYDYLNFGNTGSFYTIKEKSIFDEIYF